MEPLHNTIHRQSGIPELEDLDERPFDALPHGPTAAVQREPLPTVLVVDDDPAIASILNRLLQRLLDGYEIISTTNPAALLQQLANRTVPLVITDLNMPGLSGLHLAAQIKAQSPTTRVILLTASATPEMEHQALQQNVDYYLPKPFQLTALEQLVDLALAAYRSG